MRRGSRASIGAASGGIRPAAAGVLLGRSAACLDRIRQPAQDSDQLTGADAIEDDAASPGRGESAGPGHEAQMARDDGEIDRAALRNLAHRARAPALAQACEEPRPGGVAQRAKEARIKESVDRTSVSAGKARRRRSIRRCGLHRLASGTWLHDDANIAAASAPSRGAPEEKGVTIQLQGAFTRTPKLAAESAMHRRRTTARTPGACRSGWARAAGRARGVRRGALSGRAAFASRHRGW